MNSNGIQLPDEVRISLERNNLVIFAGAGVSCPPPSNLPLFNQLASKICGGCPVPEGREDQFLDEYKRKHGTDVHVSASQILCNPETRPTDYCEHLWNPRYVITLIFLPHFPACFWSIFTNIAQRIGEKWHQKLFVVAAS